MSDPKPAKYHDTLNALRGFIFLDAVVRLGIYLGALALSLTTLLNLRDWPAAIKGGAGFGAVWEWCLLVGAALLLFNFFYVALLVVLRLPIPQPTPGEYTIRPGEPLARSLVWSCLIATLTKARYEAPWPGFFVFHFANLPPLCWLMSAVFGPKSRSCYVTEPQIIDPHLVTIGRNVIIGFGSTIAGHFQDRDRIVIRPTIIEDDVIIGGMATMSGVHIKRGAVIGACSLLLPGTVVGENEYWSGNPARRRLRDADTRTASREERKRLAESTDDAEIAEAQPAS